MGSTRSGCGELESERQSVQEDKAQVGGGTWALGLLHQQAAGGRCRAGCAAWACPQPSCPASRLAQAERYKALLLKQRDIMIALTQRLNERDEQILGLQAELEAYDTHQKWVRGCGCVCMCGSGGLA